MRVIYDGRQNKEQTRKIHCQECGSVAEVTISELGEVYPDRDGAYFNFTCPVCDKVLYLDAVAVKNNTLYVPNIPQEQGRSR